MENLIPALIKAKQQFQLIAKDGYNPYHKSKYCTLDSVIKATEPALLANGLVVIQTLKTESDLTVLVTTLYHSSGEFISSEYPIQRTSENKVTNYTDFETKANVTKTETKDGLEPQKLGAAITYARRYAYSSIIGVTADEDDDAQSISTPKNTKQNKKPPYNPPQKAASQNILKDMEPWKNWKTPEDALTWASQQLPEYSLEELKRQFDSIKSSNGKKAPIWVEKIEELVKQQKQENIHF